ncbi:MAG: thioredoxin [Blastocatellales bacterium]
MNATALSHLILCSSCGATNRVSGERLRESLTPVCGKCGAELHVSDYPVTVTDADFSSQVETSPLPVLLDMWAPWCAPCRMLGPVIDQIATEMAGRVRVAKINIDENQMTSARFNVSSIPTLIVFKGGREVDRMLGVQPKAEILRRLNRLI